MNLIGHTEWLTHSPIYCIQMWWTFQYAPPWSIYIILQLKLLVSIFQEKFEKKIILTIKMVKVQDDAVFSILLGLYVWLHALNRSLDFDSNDVCLLDKPYLPLLLHFCSIVFPKIGCPSQRSIVFKVLISVIFRQLINKLTSLKSDGIFIFRI